MKNIAVISGSRAEYGLLYWTLKELKKSKLLNFKLIVTGTHLSKEHGSTYKEIINDGFKIDHKVNILNANNTTDNIPLLISICIKKISKIFSRTKPDLIVILGDRYEIFACAISALAMNIPIAHIHGGELTEGVIDNAIRHSITKMSHLHFVSHIAYMKRVHQLGENKKNIFHVGALGIENIIKLNLLNKNGIQKKLETKFNKKNLLVTFHPITLDNKNTKKYFQNLLKVLLTMKDTNIYFTKANADANGKLINDLIDKFVINNSSAFVYASLGKLKYLSLLKYVDGIVGNSSSGILEAPSLQTGTINIGTRQTGRLKPKSVIDCGYDEKNIKNAINILFSNKFQKSLRNVSSPYYKKNTSINIVKKLEKISLNNILIKKFVDE